MNPIVQRFKSSQRMRKQSAGIIDVEAAEDAETCCGWGRDSTSGAKSRIGDASWRRRSVVEGDGVKSVLFFGFGRVPD